MRMVTDHNLGCAERGTEGRTLTSAKPTVISSAPLDCQKDAPYPMRPGTNKNSGPLNQVQESNPSPKKKAIKAIQCQERIIENVVKISKCMVVMTKRLAQLYAVYAECEQCIKKEISSGVFSFRSGAYVLFHDPIANTHMLTSVLFPRSNSICHSFTNPTSQ
ncbi:hypothetical protein BDA99DRAFT_538077 [Phascolomyces articulosus]|uniref:Uncharacterized protein n=1 Tax=Phascolomyces articulosus TaxID=60185 RepID=A0AAD5JZN4_9FUNG|nr:hypothetical protein BDA99DRAFT_538077 [Phascolomyces articulosus]